MLFFASDYLEGAHPAILDALARTNLVPQPGYGEDLSFCLRVRDSGTQIWCDSSVKCGHVGMAVYDENAYRALRGAQT